MISSLIKENKALFSAAPDNVKISHPLAAKMSIRLCNRSLFLTGTLASVAPIGKNSSDKAISKLAESDKYSIFHDYCIFNLRFHFERNLASNLSMN